MTIQVEIPDLLARQVSDLAAEQKVSVDQFVAAARTAQGSAAATRPSIRERAQRVNWQKVDEILTRVPDRPPLPDDER
jgi:hypothetical protein